MRRTVPARQLGPPERARVAAIVEGPQLGPLERARMAATVAGSRLGALERNDLGAWRATQQAGEWQRRDATWGGSRDVASAQASASGARLPPQGGWR
jgi:hypothetical protein